MAYLSRIELDPRSCSVADALGNRGVMHAAIERTSPGERPHILWRLEENGSEKSVLMVSGESYDLSGLQERFGKKGTSPNTLEYDKFIGMFEDGTCAEFKVVVNPVVRIREDGAKNSKEIPLNLKKTAKYPYSAEDWLRDKMEENGAHVQTARVDRAETVMVAKENGGNQFPLFIVTYSGTLKVTDAEKFRRILTSGLGRKKAYGCGLVTAKPIPF